jgi:hypothetical protein
MQAFKVAAPKLQTAALKYEVSPMFCREIVPLLAGSGAKRIIEIGTVLGLAWGGAFDGAIAARAGNTGNGTAAMHTTETAAGVVPGVYTAICVEPAANLGSFQVSDPAGVPIGTAVVGTLFDGVVKFTISDGATDFIVGDGFNITVTAPVEASKALAWTPAATDGSEIAAAVALDKAVAQDGVDGSILILRRGPAIVSRSGLVYAGTPTDAQKAAAIAALEARGILIRDD